MSLCLRLLHFGRRARCRSYTQKNSVTNHCRECRRHQHSVKRSSNTSDLESSLFVSGVYQDDSLLLSLNLDIEAMLHDLDSNLHARKHTGWSSGHISQFKNNYQKYAEISGKLKNIEDQQKNTSALFQSIKHKQKTSTLTKEEAEQERAILRDMGRQLKLQHTNLMEGAGITPQNPNEDEYFTLEQVVIFHALRIPNHLHIETPSEELKELDRCGYPEKVEISDEKLNKTLKKCVKFSNIGRRSYYLMSDAAMKEQELVTSVSSRLRATGFTHMVCPEIFKTVPVEGAGITPQNPNEIYNLEVQDTYKDKSHILPYKEYIRGTSIVPFLAYFTRHVVASEHLPSKLFTVGRSYDVKQERSPLPGLYGAPQNICAEVAALTRDATQNEALYDELQASLWMSLKDQGIPARMVLVPAHSLHCSERKRTEVQFWSPSLQQYVQVGSMSCYGDYFSRRLMFRQSPSLEKQPVSKSSPIYTIHGRWANITRLVALHIEYSCQLGGDG